jgi:hypothetical protein
MADKENSKEKSKENSKNEISYEDVVRAVEELRSSNQVLTMTSIRESLGSKGSVTQIAKHLKKWVSESADANNPKDNSKSQDDGDLSKANIDKAGKNISGEGDINKSDNKSKDPKQSGLLRSRSGVKSVKVSRKFKDKENTENTESTENTENTDNKQNKTNIQQPPRKKHKGPVDTYAQKAGFKEDHLSSQVEFEPLTTAELNKLDKQELIIKTRQLQSVISREQNRTETAEKLTSEANVYAQALKDQVGYRINDLKDSMTVQVSQLKNQIREFKLQADEDLNYYRVQLEKATAKMVDKK